MSVIASDGDYIVGSYLHLPRPSLKDVDNEKRQSGINQLPNYDYVVVGSGIGGGPVAANLAIAGYKVLLLDAGDDEGTSYQERVPALQLQATEYTPMRWDYFVSHYANQTRQEEDSKFTWRTPTGELFVGADPPSGSTPLGILYPRAGTLGGCSAHNAMITIYPHDSDWTYIQTLTDDDSWAPENMRTYFEKLEKNRYLPNSIVGHGFTGWLGTALTSLSLVVEDQKLLSLVAASATAMGKSLLGLVINTVVGLGQVLLRDVNAPGATSETGLYQVPLAMFNSTRNGARDFILETTNAVNADGSRKYHLDIRLETLVTKVRFTNNGSTPQAVGVDFISGKSLYRADPRSNSTFPIDSGSVNVTREVILSAGTFNTPQLLKLSGIGPASELQKFNISVVVDLPGVGTNLQDHYENTIIGETQTPFTIIKDCTFLRTLPDPCLDQWSAGVDETSKGTYATNGIAIAIIKKSSVAGTNPFVPNTAEPDLLISGAPAYFRGYYPGYSVDALKDARHWSWIVLKVHNRNNAGTVQLSSSDPRDTPVINFNYYDTGITAAGADEDDLQSMYEGLTYSRQIFKDLIPLDGSFKEIWPGQNVTSEAEMKAYSKGEAWGHHASCTCPIGADGDPMAVLDSKFRVRGTKNLRVVDASVFPKIPGYYVSLPLYIVAEKASDVIIKDEI
ncbi:hypothetical protein F5884DRAFT_749744 [Xylogone sp. PMI_703]|nr:hypothetical protein F5884DRAFT_749744 [Xylogone sp. PMI_703]